MKVYVVTGLELGWDNVVTVYHEDVSLSDISKEWPADRFVITERTLETKVEPEF
jgi:hypothetical protein